MGTMTVICSHYHALHWMFEWLTRSSDRSPQFGDCCLSGKINLPILQDVPHTLKSLLEDCTSEVVSFWNKIRQYNMALTFTSLGANFDRSLPDGSGPYVLKLYGEIYHNHGALIPNENRDASYAQLYIYDSQMALHQRMNRNQSLDRDTMSHHPFVLLYRQAAERLREQGTTLDVQVRLTYHPHSDPRRYNVPTGNEIAVILPRENITEDNRDIVVQLRGRSFQRVYDTNPAYVPLHYVLLFPRGEFG